MRALVCPYCGATLTINLETVGPQYLTREQPESIECYASDCEAEWEPNGEPRAAPRWERYPDLYKAPRRAIEREAARVAPPASTPSRSVRRPPARSAGVPVHTSSTASGPPKPLHEPSGPPTESEYPMKQPTSYELDKALGPVSVAVANLAADLMHAEAERNAHRETLRRVADLAAEWERCDSSDFRSGPLLAALAVVRESEATR